MLRTTAWCHFEFQAAVLARRGRGALALIQLYVLYRVPSGAAAAIAQGYSVLNKNHGDCIHQLLRIGAVLIVHR